MTLNRYLPCLLLLILFSLSACDRKGSFHDLRDYVAQLDKSAALNQKQKKLTAMTSVLPVTYQKQLKRMPFENKAATSGGEKTTINNPTNLYPLNALKFVGTVSQNNHTWAYIMTPDHKLYQLTINDTLGDHSGRIIKITTNEIEVVEPPTENNGVQRIVTLQLTEERADNG
jgi:type IV pilus assembly protein PilP